MGEIFLKLLNMSITASWIILAVLGIRLLFRRIPKWISCLLWGIVAIRLIFPFSIESTFSLQPSAEPIKSSTMVEGERIPYVPFIDSNVKYDKSRTSRNLCISGNPKRGSATNSDRNRRGALVMRNGGASYFGIGEYDKIAPMCKGSCAI